MQTDEPQQPTSTPPTGGILYPPGAIQDIRASLEAILRLCQQRGVASERATIEQVGAILEHLEKPDETAGVCNCAAKDFPKMPHYTGCPAYQDETDHDPPGVLGQAHRALVEAEEWIHSRAPARIRDRITQAKIAIAEADAAACADSIEAQAKVAADLESLPDQAPVERPRKDEQEGK